MKCRKNDFTITELLVVIAILVILTSLLQPSLKSIMMAGDSIHCLNNQRQIYQGYLFYGEENTDHIIPGIQMTNSGSHWRNSERLVTWDEALINYFRDNPIPEDQINKAVFHNYKRNFEVEGLDILSCPRHTALTQELHNYVSRDWTYQRSYSTIGIPFKNTTNVNHDHYYLKNGPSGMNWSMRYSDLPDPTNTFLLGEHFHGHNMVGYLALQNNRGPNNFFNYHNSRGIEAPHGDMTFNFLFTDGHSENLFLFEYGQTTADRYGPWTMFADD